MWPYLLMGAGLAAKTYGEAQSAAAQEQEAKRQQREAERFNLENIKTGERLLSEQAQPTATAKEMADLQRSLILAGAGGQNASQATLANAQRMTSLEAPNIAARRNTEVSQEIAREREALAMRHRFATMLDWIKMRLAGQKGAAFRQTGGTLMSIGMLGYGMQQQQQKPETAGNWSNTAGATDVDRSNDEYPAV